MEERIDYLDIAKEIGIISMIIGHTMYISNVIIQFIFSFHMPLFFILSGYFYRKRDISLSIRNDIKRLALPYLIASILICAWYGILAVRWNNTNIFTSEVFAAFYGSGSEHSSLYMSDVPTIGAIWFLLALFWCKNVSNAVYFFSRSTIVRYASIVGISISAMLIDVHLINLPFAILPGLSASIFFIIGIYVKENGLNKFLIIFSIVCWTISLRYSYMNMATCHYGIYPLDIIGGCGGTLCVIYLSKLLQNTKIGMILKWFGINSLCILIFHFIELHGAFWSFMHLPYDKPYIIITVRILFCIIIVLFLQRISALKSLLCIRTWEECFKK